MLTFVDFETFAIEPRPDYPPVPVGVAIWEPPKQPRYYAWGHLTKNNCSLGEAMKALERVWKGTLVFQHAKFDIAVANEHLGLPIPDWRKIHDTLFLLYLHDPRLPNFKLKPCSEKILGMAPDEQEAVQDWLISHQPVPGVRITKKSAGAYIAFAPGDLVGEYAIGDLRRTRALFDKLGQEIAQRGMQEAYDRERQLMPVLLDNEQKGVPVDLLKLHNDLELFHTTQAYIDGYLYKRLRTTGINLDSNDELADALVKAKLADPGLLGLTKTGKYQTNAEAFTRGIPDPGIRALLKYRAKLGTCVGTFMEPWYEVARRTGGTIFTQWNQVRDPAGDKGTSTGRMSSSPNFQNIPKEFEDFIKDDAPHLPIALPPLPLVRQYVAPPGGHVLIDRDYSQQELRILAHFEDDVLKDEYVKDPWLDIHEFVRQMVNEMLGTSFERKPIKNTVFGIIYGMGVGTLATKSKIEVEVAAEIKNSILKRFERLREMYNEMSSRARMNLPIRTWGGREYYCEPAKWIDGQLRRYDYKLLNLLIQGSAADCTKQAMINFHAAKPAGRLLMQVHDELLVLAKAEDLQETMECLRTCMEAVSFDVPMLSEGKASLKNWASMEKYDEKGVVKWDKSSPPSKRGRTAATTTGPNAR